MSKKVLASLIEKHQRFMVIEDGKEIIFEAHENAHRCDTDVCKCPAETADYFLFCLFARNIKTQAMKKLHFKLSEKVMLF